MTDLTVQQGYGPYKGRYPDTDLSWELYLHLWWTSRVLSDQRYCTELQRMLVESALRRGDVERADQMLVDWKIAVPLIEKPVEERHYTITKWQPGDHFYILDEKFDSREQAEAHGRANGYTTFSLRIVRVPKPWET